MSNNTAALLSAAIRVHEEEMNQTSVFEAIVRAAREQLAAEPALKKRRRAEYDKKRKLRAKQEQLQAEDDMPCRLPRPLEVLNSIDDWKTEFVSSSDVLEDGELEATTFASKKEAILALHEYNESRNWAAGSITACRLRHETSRVKPVNNSFLVRAVCTSKTCPFLFSVSAGRCFRNDAKKPIWTLQTFQEHEVECGRVDVSGSIDNDTSHRHKRTAYSIDELGRLVASTVQGPTKTVMTNAAVRSVLSLYTKNAVSPSMVARVKDKAKVVLRGSAANNFKYLVPYVHALKRLGFQADIVLMDSDRMKAVMKNRAEAEHRLAQKLLPANDRTAFDASTLDLSVVDDDVQYLCGWNVSFPHAKRMLRSGLLRKVLKLHQCHAKGKAKGNYAFTVAGSANNNNVVLSASYSYLNECKESWKDHLEPLQEFMDTASTEEVDNENAPHHPIINTETTTLMSDAGKGAAAAFLEVAPAARAFICHNYRSETFAASVNSKNAKSRYIAAATATTQAEYIRALDKMSANEREQYHKLPEECQSKWKHENCLYGETTSNAIESESHAVMEVRQSQDPAWALQSFVSYCQQEFLKEQAAAAACQTFATPSAIEDLAVVQADADRLLDRVAWIDEGTGQGLVYHIVARGQLPRYNKVNLSLQPASCDCGTNKKDRKVCIHICFAHKKWNVDGKVAIQDYVFEWQQTQHWRAQIAGAGVFEVPTFDDLDLEDNNNEENFVMPLSVPQPRGRPKTKRCKGRHELIKQAKRKLRMEAASNAHTTATNQPPSDYEEPLSDDEQPASDDEDTLSDDEELPRSPIPIM